MAVGLPTLLRLSNALDAARLIPSDAFARRLGAQLAAARQNEDQAGSRPTGRAVEASGALGTAEGGSMTPSPGSTAPHNT